jgi:hypothetical protein
MSADIKHVPQTSDAGGGLLSRRHFISRSFATTGAAFIPMSFTAAVSFESVPASWKEPGADFSNYGAPPDTLRIPYDG